jgi:NAD(P)-dependent dehydrogenase (short-subunit alcohol dehydrogenase family)
LSQQAPAVTVITGAGSGIGRATARHLAARGDAVALADIDLDGLNATAEQVRAAGGRVLACPLDVRDRPAVDRFYTTVLQELGGLTYVFSNAGVSRPAPVVDLQLADWNLVVQTHVTGAFNMCQPALIHMVQRGSGAIVIMSSDYAVMGMRHFASYAAAKSALYSLTKALARDFAASGIRVNAVGPGPIDTPALRRHLAGQDWDQFKRARADRLPMQRLGQAEEVAAVVDFLLSDRAAYITGQIVHPNGGQLMW